jgi:hypothetical protein
MMFPNLTGKIRNDAAGLGHYGAPRGSRRHDGVDYEIKPGAEVYAPCTGKITRFARPYASDQYSGVEIRGKAAVVVLFYLKPCLYRKVGEALVYSEQDIVGATVKEGDVVGIAQDVTARYPGLGMTPHVHMRISSFDPERCMNRK